jgi:hypothetical protein
VRTGRRPARPAAGGDRGAMNSILNRQKNPLCLKSGSLFGSRLAPGAGRVFEKSWAALDLNQ